MLNFSLWPPTLTDVERLRRYVLFERIFEGDYLHAFAETSARIQEGESKHYLGADWGSLIVKVSSDMLFGEHPIVSAGEDQEQLDALVEDTDLWNKLLEGSASCAFRGDAVFRLLWDTNKQRVDVREIPACNYFAETDPDDCRSIRSEAIAWLRRLSDDTLYLRVDHHTAGAIQREAYRFPSGHLYGGNYGQQSLRKITLAEAYPGENPPLDYEPTGLTRSALWHIPNLRHGSRYWGISDFGGGLVSLLDSYNERLSEIHRILSKHADPKLLLPEDVLDDDGNIQWKQLGCIEIPAGSSRDDFKFLTWDGQLQAAFKELEILADLIFKYSEIAPAVFGEDKAGSIESGRAMKFRFQRTIAKISRKRNYWHLPLIQLLREMQNLANLHGQTYGFEDKPVKEPSAVITVSWQDGLPQDTKEQVEIEVQRVGAGLTDKTSAISRIDQISEAEAEKRLEKIAQEKEKYPSPPPPQTQGAMNGSHFAAGAEPGEPGGQPPAAPAQNGAPER